MKWCILLNMPKYSVKKQLKIIIAMMALHNFIRDSAIHDADFENYSNEDSVGDSESSMDNSSVLRDDSDMGAFRDSIAIALVFWRNWRTCFGPGT